MAPAYATRLFPLQDLGIPASGSSRFSKGSDTLTARGLPVTMS